MRTLPLLLLAACSYGKPPPVDTDTDVEDTVVDGADSDTAVPWSGDTEPPSFTRDTFPVVDEPIGATALDGTWTGAFTLFEEVPLVPKSPTCAGTMTVVIDGNAERHVIADFACATWDPNLTASLLYKPYGELEGLGFATLDPADLSKFVMQAALGARNMSTLDANRLRVDVVDDHLVADFDTIAGIGTLKAGHKLTFDLVRAPAP